MRLQLTSLPIMIAKPMAFRLCALALCVVLHLPSSLGQGEKDDAAAGKDVFEAQCVSCHNADSTEAKDGPGLVGIRNGKLPSGKAATREAILDVVNKGRNGMPPFQESLTAKEKDDVVAYLLTL